MARPLRIEFPGAVYHVTSRGDRREPIFVDDDVRQQIYLGDEAFVERMQALAEPRNSTDSDIPKIQRRKSRTLAQWLQSCQNREQALYNTHAHSAMTMSAIARELGLSISRVSRLSARAEEAKGKA